MSLGKPVGFRRERESLVFQSLKHEGVNRVAVPHGGAHGRDRDRPRRLERPECPVLVGDQRIGLRGGDIRRDLDLGRPGRDPAGKQVGFGRLDRFDARLDEPLGFAERREEVDARGELAIALEPLVRGPERVRFRELRGELRPQLEVLARELEIVDDGLHVQPGSSEQQRALAAGLDGGDGGTRLGLEAGDRPVVPGIRDVDEMMRDPCPFVPRRLRGAVGDERAHPQ